VVEPERGPLVPRREDVSPSPPTLATACSIR
jgi:hypothetical protein